jgi:hypothetical protein
MREAIIIITLSVALLVAVVVMLWALTERSRQSEALDYIRRLEKAHRLAAIGESRSLRQAGREALLKRAQEAQASRNERIRNVTVASMIESFADHICVIAEITGDLDEDATCDYMTEIQKETRRFACVNDILYVSQADLIRQGDVSIEYARL